MACLRQHRNCNQKNIKLEWRLHRTQMVTDRAVVIPVWCHPANNASAVAKRYLNKENVVSVKPNSRNVNVWLSPFSALLDMCESCACASHVLVWFGFKTIRRWCWMFLGTSSCQWECHRVWCFAKSLTETIRLISLSTSIPVGLRNTSFPSHVQSNRNRRIRNDWKHVIWITCHVLRIKKLPSVV